MIYYTGHRRALFPRERAPLTESAGESLAACEDRAAVSLVLPLRLQGEGDRIRLGQRRTDLAVSGQQVRPLDFLSE